MQSTGVSIMAAIHWRAITVLVLAIALGEPLQAVAQTAAAERAATPSDSGNVYQAGGTVRPVGPVDGDFIAFGGRVVLDHPVSGDALLAGGSVDVRAPVGDDLRAGGGDVSIESSVGGELDAAGGNVTLTRAAQVGRGALLAGGRVVIDGKIAGTLKVSAQRVVLNGEVSGDVRIIADTIELGPTARIGGALRHASRSFHRADGAVIGGTVTREEREERPRERGSDRGSERHWQGHLESGGGSWIGMLFVYLGLLAAGAVFVLVFPKFTAEAPLLISKSPGLSLAIGLGVVAGVPLLAVLLFITLLGIPLGIVTFALYPLLLLMGYLCGVLFVSQRVRALLRPGATPAFRNVIGFVALALLIVMLLAMIPYVGGLLVFLITIAGIGACVLEWHRRRRSTTVSG
ncbi:MAG: polymer-forming cytoskeletal protein [Burkholderiaceae bacterium]